VARRGKNQYSWKGFGEIPRSLDELKEEGMRERLGYSSSNNSDKVYKFILLRFFVAEFFIRFFKVVWNLTLKMLPVM
jgi:hypothetical protein